MSPNCFLISNGNNCQSLPCYGFRLPVSSTRAYPKVQAPNRVQQIRNEAQRAEREDTKMKNMKKLIAVALVAIMMVCGCAAACAEQKALTPEEAKTIVLNYAGLTADQVTFTKCREDRDDGRMVYEIEFFANGVEYDFDVDIYTGRITDSDRDYDRDDRYGDHDFDLDDIFDFD